MLKFHTASAFLLITCLVVRFSVISVFITNFVDNIDFFEGYKKNGQPREVSRNGETYWAQTYLDEHENEYTRITNEEIIHYRNGVVERIWKLKNGTIIDSVTVYNDGFAMYNQSWESLSESYAIRDINNLSKDVKELVDSHTQNVIYRGSLDDNGNRIGRGFEFDAATGKLKLEGVWECNKLKSITRIFEDDNKMIEFKSTTSNLELHEQIPIYVGGYKYNELHNTCSRDGKGFLINEDGVATMEGEWKNGIETERTVMKNGWYHVDEDPLNMPIDSEVIRVPAYKLKYTNFLDLSKYKKMKTLDIGEYNFCNTESFTISSTENLETVKIDDHSFYRNNKVDRMNRTFRIVDCTKLRSIYIGSCSFYYYSGGFELRGLPNLEILEVGKVGVDSGSFSYCNFVAKGTSLLTIDFLVDLPKLSKIVIGDHAFETEEIIELSGTEFDLCVSTDLPSLETLELGWVVFSGKLKSTHSKERRIL